MTIQISVTVWTLICFTAMYLVLRNVLIKPLLEVMDRRKEKTGATVSAQAEKKRIAEEKRAIMLKKREEAAEEARKRAENEADQVRLEGKRLLEEAKEKRIRVIAEYRSEMDSQYAREMETVVEPIKRVADDFLSDIFGSEA